MSNSLSNDGSDRTSAGDSNESEELLNERDQCPWHERWEKSEHFFAWYDRKVDMMRPWVGNSTYLAEDAVNRLVDDLIKYAPTQGEFEKFLSFRRVKNKSIDAWRTYQNDLQTHGTSLYKGVRHEEQKEVLEEKNVAERVTNGPEDTFFEQEALQETLQVIERVLTPRAQKCLKYHVQGYSSKEIAEKLGISKQSVDVAICQARNKLYEHFFHKKRH